MSSLRFVAVAALMMSAIGCSGYSSPSSPSSAPSTTPTPGGASSSVAIAKGAESLGNRAYTPDNLSVAVGSTVTWMNTDTVAHTTTSDASGWNSGSLPAGGQFAFTFQTPGTYTYRCTIHPGMVGVVSVH